MTPMVDVVLVLLVFFMAGASFLVRTWQTPVDVMAAPVEASALSTDALPALPGARLEIVVTERDGVAGIHAFGERDLTRLGFVASVREAYAGYGDGDVTLVVRPEPTASYGLAVWVYDRCRLAGFERVELDAD